jgi:hypothetical protein
MDQCHGIIVCLRCHQQGHPAVACPTRKSYEKTNSEALLPRGEPGDSLLPHDRPDNVYCYLHNHQVIKREIQDLQKTFVVDATHLINHSLASVHADIQRALKWSVPFHLTHLRGNSYLLQFPNSNRPPLTELPTTATNFLHHEGYILICNTNGHP